MNTNINATLTAARSAEAALVEAANRAADLLDQVALDPIADALARLQESARNAQARLEHGRNLARAVLADAMAGFAAFEQEVTAPAEDLALPAPQAATEHPCSVAPEGGKVQVSPTIADQVEGQVEEAQVTTAANCARAERIPVAPLTPTAKEVQADAGEIASVARQDAPTHQADPEATQAQGVPEEGTGGRATRRRGRSRKGSATV